MACNVRARLMALLKGGRDGGERVSRDGGRRAKERGKRKEGRTVVNSKQSNSIFLSFAFFFGYQHTLTTSSDLSIFFPRDPQSTEPLSPASSY